ncbi:protoporphyrinogen oxidase [Narcine bancroftii]|uniref:protoporphyrinogen oxidase n=1 Tax=Narcine bancroftii TaxID=1343680 RepID=UPI003831FCAA
MPQTVIVIGAGISGLAAALHLTRAAANPKVILLEATDRVGGWLQTSRTEEGAIFEHGPRGVRPAGAVGNNTLRLVSELGLDSAILPVTYSNATSKNRYLFAGGKLCKLPSSFWSAFSRHPPFSKPLFWSVAREPFVSRGTEADESVHEFVTRRFGEELATYAVDSLCRGVFAGDSRKLSIRSCFPAIFQAERRYGSVFIGMMAGTAVKERGLQTGLMKQAWAERWAQWSLQGGMQTLPEAMEAALHRRGVEIHLQAPVTQLRPFAAGGCQVLLDGQVLTADHVFSSVPAQVLSRLLPQVSLTLTQALRAITSVSVAVVNLEYQGLVLPVIGFGHLIPSTVCGEILGVVYDSCSFPQQDRPGQPTTRLTVMMGGTWFADAFGNPQTVSQELLLQRAKETVQQQLGVTQQPLRAIVRVHQDCIPQYALGHWKLLADISSSIENTTLPLTPIGASYHGVSVNDCIYWAQHGVERLTG